MKLSALIAVLVIAAIGFFMAGCVSTSPASVSGECGVFRNPGRAVAGKTRADQRDIDSKWIEPGIAACGWPRPVR